MNVWKTVLVYRGARDMDGSSEQYGENRTNSLRNYYHGNDFDETNTFQFYVLM